MKVSQRKHRLLFLPPPLEVEAKDAIATLLACVNNKALEATKQKLGPKLVELAWEEMNLVERNQFQFITQRVGKKRKGAVLGDQVRLKASSDNKALTGRLIGFYLDGKLLGLQERAVLFDGEEEPSVCSRSDLTAVAKSVPPTPEEIKKLEGFLTSPKPAGQTNGKNRGSGRSPGQESEQCELDLNIVAPEPLASDCESTPTLDNIQFQIQGLFPEFTFALTKNLYNSVLLDIYDKGKQIGTFEDDGEDIFVYEKASLFDAGFTEQQVKQLVEIERVPF
ncbi:MAG: hypothetical protein F6K54_32640 [Okeania sp. SIO3B5]|uniref:hypothetical protein n=1 Tax=Okeania sp. SIO3B5 TaxID=2607811 RepID=UPI0013FFE45F|nr:hypothetical protein [Okeania sp. SIO3B5]NEO57410.1 hypothetical protein [Okeania sp. SIO3B5]